MEIYEENIVTTVHSIIRLANQIKLEDLANNLQIYSHEGSYDYMLLTLTLTDMLVKGTIAFKYTKEDIIIILKD